ncbi:MAG: peptidoglycan bridge formation glycyltransferase FemA/FemB family protein [Nanoarchaeota archaeon]|nr:peptidoglycan bridge formation glycyltransferase FemA/FemB family protein [Nanoarchaeota archaeon]MBU1104011.1 peptidoglycan bridge formation glycyltransferase FemA/FemB family protein [Nanoarchaeota archaeon]
MKWKGFKDIQATIIIDLSLSEAELLKNADRSRRKNVKKAENVGLLFQEVKTKEELDKWYLIYQKVWKAGGIESQDISEFKKENYKLVVVKKRGKILGGGIIEELKDKIVFKAFASLIEFQDLRVNDFLYWNAILYGKKLGKKYVDLGGWQIKSRGHLAGINEFKEKWGGKVVYYYIYSKNPAYILGRKAIRNFAFGRWFWDRIKGRPIQRRSKHKKNKNEYENKESIQHFSTINKIFEKEKYLIEKYFKGKILDLGCGCGRTTKELFDRGYDVVGVEIVEDMVKAAKDNFPQINFEIGDACDLKFSNESFDIVFFSYNGLDYIYPEKERIRALEEIERALKKGGYFIYSSHDPSVLVKKFRPKFIFRNLMKGSIFSRYKYEQQPFGGFYTYYGNLKKQRDLIEKNTSLKYVETKRDNPKDLHPYYVFKKNGK